VHPNRQQQRRRWTGSTGVACGGRQTVRGAVDVEGNQTHLLAAMTHDQGLVIAQTEVDGKTNEIPMLPTLLDQIDDLAEVVVTADALHTQRATAR
jgi:hypothetical protein